MDEFVGTTIIIGGGAAGLWILDDFVRRGRPALLVEARTLGLGQTIAAQGILHSGLKYALAGLMTPAAREARDMPALWQACLRGEAQPDLREVRVRSPHCYLWRTNALSSRLGLMGAQAGLRVRPEVVPSSELPALFRHCPGPILRVAEPVISPASLIEAFARKNSDCIVRIDAERGIEFDLESPGVIRSLTLQAESPARCARFLRPQLVLAAGAGNAALRARVGLDPQAMQRRPLHCVFVRGRLPECFGHCIDGAATRVTITSQIDTAGRMVWQLGGQVSENGVRLEPAALVSHAQHELQSVLPGVDLTDTEWTTFRVDRAEGATSNGSRPDSIRVLMEGRTTTVWPTKLVLVPQLVRAVAAAIPREPAPRKFEIEKLENWPRPNVAPSPWERPDFWNLPAATTETRQVA